MFERARFSTRAGAAALALLCFTGATAVAQTHVTAPIPLSLNDAIAIALRGNLQFASARNAVDTSIAQLRQARAPQLPGLALQDTYLYVNNIAKLSTPFGSMPFSSVDATNVPVLALQYTLFDGGLTAARVGQGVAGLAAAEADAREARGAVIEEVSSTYYGLLTALQMRTVANRAVSVAMGHVTQARELLAGGMIPRADLLRAQSELANEQVHQLDADNAIAIAQTSLDSTLNVPMTRVYEPTDPLAGPVPHFDLDSLLQSAQANRGELSAARAAVSVAERAVQAARAGSLPQIKATVADGNTQPAVVAGFHNQFSAGLSAVWPLFDNGFTAGRVAQAKTGVKQAQIGVQELQNAVELQVREAYLNVNSASQRVDAAEHLVTLTDENLRLAQVRYRGGVSTALELQDAELRDSAAQQTLAGAQAALRQGVVQLRFAAGLL